eukprot:CAMPEP_0119336470 /NCGR_PEP_ID=MMETSP1333-20130426/91913_1 /TAXON_ID=418940 /ORGANISM="Scyphosphaera apsteinii, Strain RCC1455" /LENGTH=66 /DNA_ID=CAMNT_0007347281 /DNA_START=115 /DNA_END=315 /DNA_ORIENTATION=-
MEEEGRQVHADFGWPSFLVGPGCGSWYVDKHAHMQPSASPGVSVSRPPLPSYDSVVQEIKKRAEKA